MHTTAVFPRSRLSTIDIGHLAREKHHVVALLEVDVTRARRAIRIRNRSAGSSVSLLAWITRCVARSVARHPAVHAVRVGRRRVARFSEVTASLIVERTVDGERVPLPFVVRSAEERSLAEIEAAIESARTTPVDGAAVVVGEKSNRLLTALYYALPGAIRRRLMRWITSSPRRVIGSVGSVIITSIGMGGRLKGWFIPRSIHPVCIGVGSVTPSASVINGAIEPREILRLTVLVDHDVVDDAPAARWISDLVRCLERATDLE